MKQGAFDYIPKPFTPDEFRDVIRNAVKSRTESGESKALDLMAIVSHDLQSPVAVDCGITGKYDNRDIGALLSEDFKNAHPSDSGHHQVGDYDVIRVLLDQFQSFFAAVGVIDVVGFFSKYSFTALMYDFFVVDDQ
jgi:hypothetical protein